MAAPLSPLPPTVADRDAEIAALQTAFDEYIASSRELEDELDAELAKMQEKLAESSGANAALISQLESLNPQLSQLERALSDTKRKLETESSSRRQAELAQDEAEARAREAEASLERMRVESDAVTEQLVFREEEVEEMRLELEVEKERHSVEMEELAAQLVENKNQENGVGIGASASKDKPKNKEEKKDDISVMSEDDFVTMAVGSADGVVNSNDNEDYIKRLEDELEDVTEQLIDAETNISNMEGKLTTAEKHKADVEKQVQTMETRILELQGAIKSSEAAAIAKEEQNTEKATSEELALLTEELTLTQEELKAAEEDAKVSSANLERIQATHKTELAKLTQSLLQSQNDVRNANVQVETMEAALNEANAQTSTLRDEVENLMQALKNAKQDHEKTLEDMEALRQAFDEAESDVRESSVQREEELVKEHKRKVEDLSLEIVALTEANKALKDARPKAKAGPSATEVDLQIKLDQKHSELERMKVDLQESKDSLVKSKRKVEELSAGNKALINGAFDTPKKRNEILTSPMKKESFDRFTEEEEGEQNVSIFYRSHARSRTRIPHASSKRARSSSPSSVVRLERNLADQSTKLKAASQERDNLKSQQRMSDVRVLHLEADVAKLHQKVEEAEQKSDNLVSVVAGVSQNPESREDKEFMDTEIESLIREGDNGAIANEFRALARKSTLQKEHNAQLLIRILKLQGNIQVCCRIRPMTNGEIKRATKRVVEPLSDSEVGVFDDRTKNWKSYAFDKVWGPDSHQLGVFQDVEPLALSVVDGYNACIFAYGQTGSGKTHTMEGGQGVDRGISFRTIEKVFKLLQYRVIKQDAIIQQYESGQPNQPDEKPGRFHFSISVGMLEIYNDNVHDLLVKQDKKNAKKKSLDIKRDKEGGIVVAGLTKEPVNGLKDVVKLLKRGNESRATATTDLNEHSSRSHMVLIVEVKSGHEGEEPVTGTLYLVDLAGSERVRKSAVEGQELKEATHINKSLSALGNVMEALDRKASHIPYRDSKLTYLLQDSLGGNSRTMMVVTVCPTSITSDETSHALQFATRVRRINIGSAKRNVMSKNLEQTVKEMSQQLRMLAKSKEKSEQQLKSLKKDHSRIQDRLRTSSESRAKSIDEGRTLAVLKTSNTQMTARWQKEKQLHEKTMADLETTQNEYKQLQSQLSKAKRETERVTKLVGEKEAQYDSLKGDLRKAKDASSAANLRARKAQMFQSRHSNVGPKSTNIVQPSRRGVVSGTPSKNINPEEARQRVLAMLTEHDPSKVDKIDAIMERFKGREAFLLVKMSARYEGENSSQTSSSQKSTSRSTGGAGQKRSEMALARHMERMRSRSSAAAGE